MKPARPVLPSTIATQYRNPTPVAPRAKPSGGRAVAASPSLPAAVAKLAKAAQPVTAAPVAAPTPPPHVHERHHGSFHAAHEKEAHRLAAHAGYLAARADHARATRDAAHAAHSVAEAQREKPTEIRARFAAVALARSSKFR